MRVTNRSGHYQRQISGYSAFIPQPLPPQIEFDDELRALLSKADRALGRLDGSIQTLPNPDLFVFMYVRKEAVLSSQIEGTQSSLNDLLKLEAKILNAEIPNDVDEVVNYVSAMKYGLERVKELPISTRLIREIHERLLIGVRGGYNLPGEIRTTQNWIGPHGSTLTEAVFVPPPPHEVMNALSNLETFIHDASPLAALVKIGLVHSQFETIHPFADGNGRIGRLLITFLLCQNEILISPVLYISFYFKKNRDEYYRRLQNVRDHGEWEEWLKFFLRGISEVSLEATETSRRIVALREQHRQTIVNNFGRAAGNGLILLESLFQRPVVDVNYVAGKLRVTFPAANNLIQRFVQSNILFEITGKNRYRVFTYAPYINLFNNSPSGPGTED